MNNGCCLLPLHFCLVLVQVFTELQHRGVGKDERGDGREQRLDPERTEILRQELEQLEIVKERWGRVRDAVVSEVEVEGIVSGLEEVVDTVG